jgi:hypothetical protein
LAEEWKAAALSLVPLAMTVTWMAARFEFLPPVGGQPLRIEALGPASSAGAAAHLTPAAGVEADNGWVRVLRPDEHEGQPAGAAEWTIRAPARGEPYRLVFRCGEGTMEHLLAVGRAARTPPIQRHAGGWTTMVQLAGYRPLGLLSPIPALAIPAWLIAYLPLTIACFCWFKRLGRVA